VGTQTEMLFLLCYQRGRVLIEYQRPLSAAARHLAAPTAAARHLQHVHRGRLRLTQSCVYNAAHTEALLMRKDADTSIFMDCISHWWRALLACVKSA